MILLLYGEDSYRSREKLRAIRDRFLATSGGELNYSRLVVPDFTVEAFREAIRSTPFLSRKRLAVVEGLFTGAKPPLAADILEVLPERAPSTVVVFYEPQVVREEKLFKALLEQARSERFDLLEGKAFTDWIKQRATALGGAAPPPVAEMLARYVGPDLWRMDQELRKLINYSPEISAEAVELLVRSDESAGIFELVDAIGEKREGKALKVAHRLLERGETELYLLSMIVRQMRTILLVKSLRERGVAEPSIAKRLRLHPFVAKKAARQSENFEGATLRKIYDRLLQTDLRLKSGDTDPAVTIDLLIAELCRA